MTVYVDKARVHANGWGPFLKGSCHMAADTIEELHGMAQKIGMKRSWYQAGHYDLVPARRAKAVKLGAVEVDAVTMLEASRKLMGMKPLFTRDEAGRVRRCIEEQAP